MTPILNTWEHQYLSLCGHILERGEDRADRTGTGTRAVFGAGIYIDLADGFPLITTKKMGVKSIISELLWFLEGSQDERRLAEILHGTRDPSKKTIWSPNAEATTGSVFQPTYPGDLGRIYGVQWRTWKHLTLKSYGDNLSHEGGGMTYFGAKVLAEEVDQIGDLIHRIKTKPTDRRLLFTAWNPGEIDDMALPPCHMFAQFYVGNDKTLSCQMYQRSVDTFLGLPFNIASYAALTMMIAQVCDLKPGRLSMLLGDTHIYKDHFNQVRQQLTREPLAVPRLLINPEVKDIDGFKMSDFTLEGYSSHESIKGDMSK
jgi:thymidylate synthase